MATIPEVRERMAAMAIRMEEEHGLPAEAAELDELIQELYRRPAARRAPRKSEPLTDAMKKRIRVYAAKHPKAHFTEIADYFNVNPGRVSNALNGVRT